MRRLAALLLTLLVAFAPSYAFAGDDNPGKGRRSAAGDRDRKDRKPGVEGRKKAAERMKGHHCKRKHARRAMRRHHRRHCRRACHGRGHGRK